MDKSQAVVLIALAVVATVYSPVIPAEETRTVLEEETYGITVQVQEMVARTPDYNVIISRNSTVSAGDNLTWVNVTTTVANDEDVAIILTAIHTIVGVEAFCTVEEQDGTRITVCFGLVGNTLTEKAGAVAPGGGEWTSITTSSLVELEGSEPEDISTEVEAEPVLETRMVEKTVLAVRTVPVAESVPVRKSLANVLVELVS